MYSDSMRLISTRLRKMLNSWSHGGVLFTKVFEWTGCLLRGFPLGWVIGDFHFITEKQ